MNIKFSTFLLAALMVFSFVFFISAPAAQAEPTCFNFSTDGTGRCVSNCAVADEFHPRTGALYCPAPWDSPEPIDIFGRCPTCPAGTSAPEGVGINEAGNAWCVRQCSWATEEEMEELPGTIAGCCKVQCPDSTIKCNWLTDISTCSNISFLDPDSTCGGADSTSANGSAGRLCRTVEGCPEYEAPTSGGTPGTGTGAAGGTGTAGGGGASVAGGTVALPNPLGTSDFRIIFGRLIQALTGLIGGLALLMFIYGGFHWLTSAGNPEKIKKGQDIILWAVIGIFLMFIAYFVIRYFLIGLTEGGLIPPR